MRRQVSVGHSFSESIVAVPFGTLVLASGRGVCLTVLAGSAVLLAGHKAVAQVFQTPLLDQLIQPSNAGGDTAFQPGLTVVTRPRPDYDSSGISAGNFVIRPELDESTGYDSNVLSTPRPHGSPLIETNASLSADNDFGESHLGARLSVDDIRYPSQPDQNFTNWTAELDGSHQFGLDILSTSYTHLTLSETPGGLDTPQLQTPLAYNIDSGRISYRANFSHSFLTPTLEVAQYTFGNGIVQGAGYDQSYRDRIVVTPSLTAGYEFSPHRNAVLVVRDSIASYQNRVADQPGRDYNDISLLGGLDYDTDSVIRYRVLAGYEARTFSASTQFKSIQAPIVEGTAIWSPTEITTVTGTLARRIEDSADETTAGYTLSYAQLRLDHEYLPNVLLHASGGIYFTQYRDNIGNQSLYTFGLGATYLMNRNMQLGVGYDFTGRNSPGGISFGLLGPVSETSNYTDHRIALTLKLRL